MGDDEENFSSSINKPSLEQASEKLILEEKKFNGEEELNNEAEQCEFRHKSEGEDVALMEKLETEAVAVAVEEEGAVEGEIEGKEGMSGEVPLTVDAETKMEVEAEAVVIGGEKSALVAEEGPVVQSNMEVLDERVGGEKSDFHSADMQVMDSGGRMEVLAEEAPVTEAELEEAVGSDGGETVVSGVGDHELLSSAGPVVAAEASEAVDLRAEVVPLGDGEKNASDTVVGPVAAIEEAEAVVETVDLREDEATVNDGERNASDIGVGSVAAIGECESVVETVDLQEDEGTVGNGEKNASDIAAKSVAAVEETKAIFETVDSQVERTVGDRDEDAGNTGMSSQLASTDTVFVGKSDVMVVDEAVAVVEGEKPIKADNIQSIANESVDVEEVSKMAVMPVESPSLMVVGVEKTEESGEGKESVIESAEMKVEMEISSELAKVTEGENVTGLQVLQFVDTEAPNSVKQEKDKLRGIINEESLVADAKLDDIKETEDKVGGKTEEESIVANAEMEASKSFVPSFQEERIPAAVTETDKGEDIKEMKDNVRGKTEEGSIVADAEMEASKSSVPSFHEEGLPVAVTEMDMEKDADMETAKVDDVESTPKIDDSSSVPPEEDKDAEMVAEEELALADTELETETDAGESSKGVGEKRKRGKNFKNMTNSKIVTRAQKIIDEDVCFICFDGGDLVLCDRRGCPKAYHPSCVNRDESFFRSKGRWNCGWHICSICQKNAHYMCYTCPFALCKGCIKDAVILCVRGNKGFCETCMRFVMLIENSDEGTNDVQIDFDDKSSWEYLFKDYFIDLKSKLSLTSAEIAKAKNPWKGSDVSASKEESPEAPVGTNNIGSSGTGNSAENPEARKPKRKRVKKRLRSHAMDEDSAGAAVRAGNDGVSTAGNMEWASKELLEFVMHMKNGDKSVLSQFDVQALLLEYIKRNKLRDPLRKSQIICDLRLENLFGKPRVGHFEMLKLLESHFFVKDDAHADDVQGSVVDTEVNQVEADENAETPTKGNKERKRKVRKKGDRGHLSNRYEYAAINIHNISLIYLRRKLMEDLLEDIDGFQHKVIGTFVRIRISGNTQKQDLYRLVQVVGTSKVDEPYKVGKRTTDVMLEILNLNKTEIVSIDTISNQDFTEEECKRLRQSIKCGLLNRMTVGDILDKAMEVQAARVNDWLESEILRLSHLRDRASDMGRRKELRECVEKLQILKMPEERLRRLEEIPKIHADPNMDPNHESEDEDSDADDNRREVFQRTSSSGFTRRGTKDSLNGGNISSKNWESNKSLLSKNLSISGEDANAIQSGELVNEKSWNQGREKDTEESNNLVNLNPYAKSENVGLNINSVARSEPLSGVVSVNSSVSLPAKEAETVMKINETQKTWHYLDPSGKVQGPFSLAQLRKWSNTGYFPTDLRIWRTTETQDDSILLTDALAGRFQKETSGDTKLLAAGTVDAAHGLYGHSGKTSDTSLLLSRDSFGERSDIDPNRGAQSLHLAVSKGLIAPPVEVPKLSTGNLTRNELSNLPSPTPKHSNAGETGERGVTLIGGTSYPGVVQSPAAALPLQGSLSSVHASVLNSREQFMNSLENDSVISGTSFGQAPNSEQKVVGSVNSLPVPSLTATGEPHALEEHGHHPPAHDNGAHSIQPGNSQNSRIESHGWLAPHSQKVEQNDFVPVPGQTHAYSPWGVSTPLAQNPTGSFSNSGASTLPQPEFLGPPAQSNQPMQAPMLPNLAWGTGQVENNSSAPMLRPENSNNGWVPMQSNPNMGWVGAAPVNTNINWGATGQGPAPGNANSGWATTTGNLGSSMQGQMAGNVNAGWVAPPGNSGVQGLAFGNPGWMAPAGNVGSAVQVPAPGNGWALPTGNQGAPQGVPSGNTNQGWGAPPGNQGTWGTEQYQSGGNFSSQRDTGSQAGDSGFGDGRPKGSNVGDSGYRRPWNRQSSFGSRAQGPDLRNVPRDVLCPYNKHGKCRKGSRCNYIHA